MSEPRRFDPDAGSTDKQVEAAIGRIGWWGVFPTTPCPNCDNGWFVPAGDWSMGWRCTKCRHTWRGP